MRNLYEETVAVLTVNGKTLDDIIAVQGEGFAISVEEFVELAKQLDYDSGFGASHVATDLVIIGDDWWMERGEYDGSEWWEFRRAPKPIQEIRSVAALGSESEMWPTLNTFLITKQVVATHTYE